jgi:hypothetical protein
MLCAGTFDTSREGEAPSERIASAGSSRSPRSIRIRKAGKQEQPQEPATRLGSSVVLAKLSSKPRCLPRAFSCERITAKWMSSRFLIALRSTTMVSDSLGQGFVFQGHLSFFIPAFMVSLSIFMNYCRSRQGFEDSSRPWRDPLSRRLQFQWVEIDLSFRRANSRKRKLVRVEPAKQSFLDVTEQECEIGPGLRLFGLRLDREIPVIRRLTRPFLRRR